MGGGGERIDAEVRVLHGAQLRFQQDLFPIRKGSLHKGQGIADIRGDLLTITHKLLEERFGVQKRLVVEMFKEHVLDLTDLLQTLHQPLFIKELADLDAIFGIFVGVEGSDSGLGGTERMTAQPLLLILILEHMVRHQHLGPFGDDDVGGGDASRLQVS